MGSRIVDHPCANPSFRFYDDRDEGSGITMETELDVASVRLSEAERWIDSTLPWFKQTEKYSFEDIGIERVVLTTCVSGMTQSEIIGLQDKTMNAINEVAKENMIADRATFLQPVFVY